MPRGATVANYYNYRLKESSPPATRTREFMQRRFREQGKSRNGKREPELSLYHAEHHET
jgi:hypothetical protein